MEVEERSKDIYNIDIREDGSIECNWWSPAIADFICSMCRKCSGWRSEDKPIDCLNGNPWCG